MPSTLSTDNGSRARKVRCGFTLIELLIVITIIAVLGAMLFPVLVRAKAAAGDAMTISNSRQLGCGFMLYANDSDDVLPQACDGEPGQRQAGGWVYYSAFRPVNAGTFDVSLGTLYPYILSTRVYLSSGDPDATASGNSFAFNGYLSNWSGTGLNLGKASSAIEQPSSTMLLGDEGTGMPSLFAYGYSFGTNDGYFNPPTDHFGKFHPGGTCVAFTDGHAKIFQAEDLFVKTICGTGFPCYH